MVTLKGRFNGGTGKKFYMLILVDITESGIKVRRWGGEMARGVSVLIQPIVGLGVSEVSTGQDGDPRYGRIF